MKYVRAVEGIPETSEQPVQKPQFEIPLELKGMSIEYLENTRERLNIEMWAEIEVIKARYTDRIRVFERAIEALKSSEFRR